MPDGTSSKTQEAIAEAKKKWPNLSTEQCAAYVQIMRDAVMRLNKEIAEDNNGQEIVWTTQGNWKPAQRAKRHGAVSVQVTTPTR